MEKNFVNIVTGVLVVFFVILLSAGIVTLAVSTVVLTVIASAMTYGIGTTAVICFGTGLLISAILGTIIWVFTPDNV